LLIFVSVVTVTVRRISGHLLVVLLERGQVLTGLTELAFLHAFAHVPVDERPFRVHQVELVVEPGPGFSDRRCVGQHAHGPLHLSQVTTRHHRRRLVVDTYLEPGWAPVHELYGPFCLDGGDGRVHVLRHHITSIQHATRHVLSVPRVALDHLVGRLKTGVGDLGHGHLFVVRFLG